MRRVEELDIFISHAWQTSGRQILLRQVAISELQADGPQEFASFANVTRNIINI